MTHDKEKVLFLCTHNSVRSQMAEGWLGHLYGDRFDPMSAGAKPAGVSRTATQVMAEVGIDISNHRSESVEEYLDRKPDIVVTVCDNAREHCPVFPGKCRMIHRNFYDPGTAEGDRDFIVSEFRRIRDEIGEWIRREFG